MTKVFLSFALALPLLSVPDHGHITVGDIKILKMLRDMDDSGILKDRSQAHAVAIGSPRYWVALFRSLGIQLWRVSVWPSTPFDLIAAVDYLPFRVDSCQMIIYSYGGGTNKWDAMKYLSQALYPLRFKGYFMYRESKAPLFRKYLNELGYEQLPFIWNEYLIFQKRSRRRLPLHEIIQIRQNA